MAEQHKFLIVDGSSLIHRAFFALPLLTNAQGQYTNAVYGFATMLQKILAAEKPDRVAVCFDKSRVTFRTEIYAAYKGTRSETPEELKPQFELAKQLLEAMGVVWEEIAGYEADDIIGTLARLGSQNGEVLILTGDRDSLQLIGPHTKVMLTKKGITNTEIWDEAALQEHYQLMPKQMIDLKALMGDTSDNIPGITGVGEKTALKLLAEYHDLDTVLSHAEEITAKGLRKKVVEGKEQALLSRTLATIDCHLEEQFDSLQELERYDYQPKSLTENPALVEFFQQMGFQSLLKSMEKEQGGQAMAKETEPAISVDYQLVQDQHALAALLQQQEKVAIYFWKEQIAFALADDTVWLLPWQKLLKEPEACLLYTSRCV